MRAVHAHVGSAVAVSAPRPGGGSRTSSYRVVGTTVFPPDFGAGGLGTGAVFTFGGFLDAQCPPGRSQAACGREAYEGGGGSYLLRFARGPDGRAAARPSGQGVRGLHQLSRHSGQSGQLRRGGELPPDFWSGAHRLRYHDPGARPRGERGPAQARGRPAQGIGVRTSADRLFGVVANDDDRARRPRRRCAGRYSVGRAVWQEFARSLGVLPDAVVVPWVIVAVAAGTSSSPAHSPSVPPSLPPDPDPPPSCGRNSDGPNGVLQMYMPPLTPISCPVM